MYVEQNKQIQIKSNERSMNLQSCVTAH